MVSFIKLLGKRDLCSLAKEIYNLFDPTNQSHPRNCTMWLENCIYIVKERLSEGHYIQEILKSQLHR